MSWHDIVKAMTLFMRFSECQHICLVRLQLSGLRQSTSVCLCAMVVQCLVQCVCGQSKYCHVFLHFFFIQSLFYHSVHFNLNHIINQLQSIARELKWNSKYLCHLYLFYWRKKNMLNIFYCKYLLYYDLTWDRWRPQCDVVYFAFAFAFYQLNCHSFYISSLSSSSSTSMPLQLILCQMHGQCIKETIKKRKRKKK